MADNRSPQESLLEAMRDLDIFCSGVAEHAAHVANARRRLYLAYINEGFTEPLALELCKSLTL